MKCRECGRKNPLHSEFCSGCGRPLTPPPPPPPAPPETGAESNRWVVVWTIVALLIVGVLCYYAFQPELPFKPEEAPDPGTISGVRVHAGTQNRYMPQNGAPSDVAGSAPRSAGQ